MVTSLTETFNKMIDSTSCFCFKFLFIIITKRAAISEVSALLYLKKYLKLN